MSDKEISEIQINMAKIETKLEVFGNRLDEHITDQKKDIDEIKGVISRFVDSADKKYAPMWTAGAIKWTIIIVMGAVFTALLKLILIK